MQISESIEDYLERILMLQKRKGAVHSIDIAVELGVTKPSVSRAMKLLRENGYILMDQNSAITLTEKGLTIADKVYERHNMLAQFLIRLGVSEKTAYADACKMEHVLSEESFEAICAHANARK